MLALIAGEGRLPAVLAASQETPPLICELDGFPSGVSDAPLVFRIEQLGNFLADLTGRGVTEVCFAGAIRRPPLNPAQVDAATMPLVPRMMQALQSGDDAALRMVIAFFEEAGLTVRAAHDVLPDLLPVEGVLTAAHPGARDERDAERATDVARVMAVADVGQALVVAAGQVLALEAAGGTDWMLRTLGGDRRPEGPSGGLLYKAPKEGQDRRVDLPVIGPETIAGAAAAGLSGIVIEAGGVMVLDRDATVRAADDAGLFLWVRAA
ncbi:MAG: UDP-2,3-diacylglucosamine diphosphatase LpxI [Pseudomonadota bacterium]